VAVAVVTDSACDLPPALVAERRITIVPLDVRFGPLSPGEVAGLSPEQFWRSPAWASALPQTSAPSPGAFRQAFLAAVDNGADGVICVTISSDLSATYQAALAGAGEVGDVVGVEVIDSRSATMGEGLLVLEAAERAGGGAPLAECAAAVRAAVERIAVFGTLDTLDNLRRGGRIGAAQALVGSLLSIKPVIEVRDGVVEPESRQRTRSRSLEYLVEKLKSAGPLERLAVVHADASDLDQLLERLAPCYPPAETIVSYIGPVIGAHTGKGTVGICLQRRAGGAGD